MRISGLVKLLMVFLAIFLAVTAYAVYGFQVAINSPFSKEFVVVVEEGDTLSNVIEELKSEDIIRQEIFVKLSVKVFNLSTNIKPGEYAFEKSTTLDDFVADLNEGIVSKEFIKVTVPEGYSIEKIAEVLGNSDLGFTSEEFLNAVSEYTLPSYVKFVDGRRYGLEGFLFPDTYHFDKGSTPEIVIGIMLNRFEEVLTSIEEELGIKINQERIDEIVTMASVVEREIIHDEERPKAASVFYNRLNIDMPLQSCATVIYALGKHKEVLYNRDLLVESDYNTYKYGGLPIGPISAPGRASLKAAIAPDETDYLYFILNDETNYHYFFKEYSDFLNQKSIRDTTLNVKP